MFVDFQDALIKILKAQCTAGKHLSGTNLIQFGDRTPPPQYLKAITVDWDNKIHMVRAGNGWQPRAFFAIAAYATDPVDEVQADQKLQEMIWRWEDGLAAGLIPMLVALGGVRGASGHAYGMEIQPQMGRGSLSDAGKRVFRVGAYLILEVWPKPVTPDQIKPL